MKKYIHLLLCLCMLFGCNASVKEKEEPIQLYLFYLDTCQHCEAFRNVAIPALEKEFKEGIECHYVNMDYDGNNEVYDSFTEKLEDYNEKNRLVPFIVVDGYFAILMYNEGEEVTLIYDIKAAKEGKELSELFKNERWLFKEEYRA